MDTVTALITASELLGELATKAKGSDKEQIEILKSRIDLADDQVEFVTRERDALKQQVAERNQQVKEPEERVAYR